MAEEYIKVASLENEIEARLLEPLLQEMEIPYIIHSNYDLAYDGLFQATRGWGHIETTEENRQKVVQLLDSIRETDKMQTEE
jgi:hypothetical protein